VIEISPNERYHKVRLIQFAEVLEKTVLKTSYRAIDIELGCEVAWTEISLKKLSRDEISQLSTRVIMNRKFQHKHLKSVVSSWVLQNSKILVLISEIVTGGSLLEYLNRLPQSTLRLAQVWGKGILMGLDYLHGLVPLIVHRGITTKTIRIMSSDGTIKLTDFFINQVFTADPWEVEDPWFSAPETFEGRFTQKSDIYSFGMVLLQILTKTCPYSECQKLEDIYECILNRTLPKSLEKIADPSIKSLIKACLAEPSQRPSAKDLLSHSFFESVSREPTKNLQDFESETSRNEIFEKVFKKDKNNGNSENQEFYAKNKEFDMKNKGFVKNNQELDTKKGFYTKNKGFNEFYLEFDEESQGQEDLIKKISLIILDSNNKPRNVSFEYDTTIDTPEKVALEMVESFQMGKKAVSLVAEQIKKKLVFEEVLQKSPKTRGKLGFEDVEKPVLKTSYSFDELNSRANDSLERKFKKMLATYYTLGVIDEELMDDQFYRMVKNFQRDIGVVSDGNITHNLYRNLKERVSKYF
jgi:WNK lysine deficient protein kinase